MKCVNIKNYQGNPHKKYCTPVIGILTYPVRNRNGKHIIILSNYRELVLMARKSGVIMYVFTPHQIYYDTGRIKGITLVPGQSINRLVWKWCTFPLPDVVYNRVPNRLAERSQFFRKARIFLSEKMRIPFFNHMFINKWDCYNWLKCESSLLNYLPETKMMNGKTLKEMLRKYPIVFLKPAAGSLGLGVARIQRVNGKYHYSILTQRGYRSNYSVSEQYIINKAQRLSKIKAYIVQQGIDLMRYYDRVFDIRVLVQKDGQNRWQITGMAARIAPPNAHTTHVTNGGRPYNLNDVLRILITDEQTRTSLQDELVHLAHRVTETIEKQSQMNFGEISLDIGIDQNLRLWILEANSKPFRFEEEDIRLLSRKRIIDYCCYLATQKEKGRLRM